VKRFKLLALFLLLLIVVGLNACTAERLAAASPSFQDQPGTPPAKQVWLGQSSLPSESGHHDPTPPATAGQPSLENTVAQQERIVPHQPLLTPAPPAKTVAETPFGVAFGERSTRLDHFMTYIHDLGLSRTKVSFYWSRLEPKPGLCIGRFG